MNQGQPSEKPLSITVDPFELLPEPEDLSGQVKILSHKPVFSGPYSCIYRGKLRKDGQLVNSRQYLQRTSQFLTCY